MKLVEGVGSSAVNRLRREAQRQLLNNLLISGVPGSGN